MRDKPAEEKDKSLVTYVCPGRYALYFVKPYC